jgi:cytosine/adenosine deaminase-related metal-dependent hydrolase
VIEHPRDRTFEAPVDLLVRGADLVVPMGAPDVPRGWVAISDGAVAGVGASGDEPDAREILDATGCLVTPGLVNSHHHMFQNLTRAFAPAVNVDFLGWWETLGRLWCRLDEEASYVSAFIGMAELALGGCTTTSDHLYVHPRPGLVDAQIEAARSVGLRLHAVRGSLDVREEEHGFLPDELVEDIDDTLSDSERLVAAYHDRSPKSMVQVGLGPCNVYDSSADAYRASGRLADELDVRLHTHLAAVVSDHQHCLDRFGRAPLDLFEDVGWGSARSWFAHAIFLEPRDVSRLAAWGAGIAHCPSSNMLILRGIAPVVDMRGAGIPVGIGCDGSASNDHASLWMEARTALLSARLRNGPTSMSARDALEMATVGSAACLGRSGEIGTLATGACGDVVAWPIEGVPFAGAWSDPIEALLRCGPVSARHTVVAGKVIVRNGQLELRNLEEMLQLHARIARSWQAVSA